jgi:hypothetical protein
VATVALTIRVSAAARAEVEDHVWAEYVSRAQQRGIALDVGAVGDPSEDLSHVLLFDPDSEQREAVTFVGVIHCGRSRWEHELRQRLAMKDSCIP